MDIIYTTGLKGHLLKSYKELDGKVHSGGRIWGWRLAQMILDLLGTITTVVAFMTLSNGTHKKMLSKQMKIKLTVWLGMMAAVTLLTLTGILLFIYAKYMKARFSWVVTTGLYNLALAHMIFYVMVLGSHDFLLKGISWPNDIFWAVFPATVLCLAASTVHFLSAIYATPFPVLVRLQRVPTASGDEGKLDKPKDDLGGATRSADDTVTEDGGSVQSIASGVEPSNSGSVGVSPTPSPTPTPGQTPNPGAHMTYLN